MRKHLVWGLAALFVLGAAPAHARDHRRGDPVVIAGASLSKLDGVTAAKLVGFRFREGRWKQIPVQLDERKLVDFGGVPGSNSAPGTVGTVYGTAAIGQAVRQYADPNTFVGADPDIGLDNDDEVALIAADDGDKAGRRVEAPKGTRGAPVAVKISDPLGGPPGFVYLYRSKGKLDPSAGRDYVDYSFVLTSGDYRSTYRRADGPNPETSTVSTRVYRIGFSDRWFDDQLAIKAGDATGVDILDGFKFQFGPNTCTRSEATFNDAEGAFVANVDGPVRAIRAYVGANSGPITERTDVFWPDRHEIVTDMRVHSGIPGPMIFHDLSAAGIGMTYLDATNLAGVAVDGVPESLNQAPPAWRLWTGSQGSLVSTDRIKSSFAAELQAQASDWYLDQANTPSDVELQCWGDANAYGQAGYRSTYPPPNTDPRLGTAATLQSTTTDAFAAPGVPASDAEQLAAQLDAPLAAKVHRAAPAS